MLRANKSSLGTFRTAKTQLFHEPQWEESLGVLRLLFGGPKIDGQILRLVATVERLTAVNRSAIDEKNLPRPRTQFAPQLLAEIGRFRAAGGRLKSARRLALCYVSLARFQPGVDLANEKLKQIFRPGSATFMDMDALAKHQDSSEFRAHQDDLRFRADLARAGHSDLL